ncbi:MAG TPA: stage II sporulation protein M [Candidatus Binatia bacterium]|nr:stage II sporulation protein M [Candidatus Binatia bacterium]
MANGSGCLDGCGLFCDRKLVQSNMEWILRREHIEFLREVQPYVKASVLLLASGIILGWLSGAQILTVGSEFQESLGSFTELFARLSKPMLASAIFINNGVKTFLVIVLGILGGVLPVAFLLLNGYAIGWVLYLSIQSKGIVSSLLAVVPHGIFELPAVLLGASVGIFLGVRTMRRLFGKLETSLRGDLGRAVGVFFRLILPLLLLAAFVEAFVTSAIVAR